MIYLQEEYRPVEMEKKWRAVYDATIYRSS